MISFHELDDCGQPWSNSTQGPLAGPASTTWIEDHSSGTSRWRNSTTLDMQHVYHVGIDNAKTSAQRPRFERGTGFLLARLGTLAARSWAGLLAQYELTQTQYAALAVLRQYGALGQQALAQIVAIDARNIVSVLDSLARRDLIERHSEPDDRRRRVIALTPSGTALADTLAVDAAASRTDFLGTLNHRDRESLNALLQRLFDSHQHPD